MINESFWSNCGVLSVDHYAVTTRDLNATTKDYLGIPGSSLLRGPGFNKSQNVDFAFIRMASGECIEILGVKDNSPITEHVLKGGGSYHTCFIVEDIDFAIKQAISEGAILVVEPREDDVFSPRRVCFMMHSNHGLFEFLESFPKGAKVESTQKKKNININKVKEASVRNIASSSKIIIQAFNSTFSSIMNKDDILNATYEEIEEWDSLKHLMLIMEIEKLSDTTFTANELSEAKSFLEINNILIKKIS